MPHAARLLLAVTALVCFGAILPASAETVALRHIRIFDSGDGGEEDATLVIEEGRIAAVGPATRTSIPDNVRILDLTGRTVVPGLITDHSHVGWTDGITGGRKNFTRENVARQLEQYQRFGVTTVMSLGMNAPLAEQLAEESRTGQLPGAELLSADRGLGMPGGVPQIELGTDQIDRPATAGEARAAVQGIAGRHARLVKIWVDDNRRTAPGKMPPEIYRAIIDEAHQHHLRVAAHVYYLEDAKALVAAGIDILAHGVRDQPVDDELITAMKAHKTWYVATLGLNESFFVYAQRPKWMESDFFRSALQPALAAQFDDAAWRSKTLGDGRKVELERDAVRINQRNVKRLYDAGVRIGFGTDSGATPLRIPGFAEHRELELLVEAGLTPRQAITIATRSAAELLELTDRGRIAKGLRADFVVVKENPSRDLSALREIEAVCCRGTAFDAAPKAEGQPR